MSSVSEFDYGSDGLLERSVDTRWGCSEMSYSFDAQGRVASRYEQNDCGGPVDTQFIYTDGGQLWLQPDGGVGWCAGFTFFPDGHVATYYDCQGDSYGYDDRGNQTSYVVSATEGTDARYDEQERLTYYYHWTNPGGWNREGFAYDGGCLVQKDSSHCDDDGHCASGSTYFTCDSSAPNMLVQGQVLLDGGVEWLYRTTFDDSGRKLLDELPLPDGGWTTTDTWIYDCNPPPPL